MDGSANGQASAPPPAGEGAAKAAPVVIKKYANRRLYNTATSSYVTLDYLAQMVKDKTDFVVYDARTGEEITRSVLTQIIFEEESKGQNMLPVPFLRQLIAFYGDSLQGMVPQYLEMSMQQFSHNQDRMRSYVQNTLGFNPFARIEEMNKQNLAMFEQAIKMFNPFLGPSVPGAPTAAPAQPAAAPTAAPPPGAPAAPSQSVDDIRRKLEELQEQVRNLTAAKPS